MFRKSIVLLLMFAFLYPAFAFEDCIISSDGKLTDIKIQHNDIIDVFPLVTISNDKNILIVHPLKEGTTKFTILKNGKDKYLFSVNVKQKNTIIDDVEGFDILTIDCPANSYGYDFELDEPPMPDVKYEEENQAQIDAPPVLRGKQ